MNTLALAILRTLVLCTLIISAGCGTASEKDDGDTVETTDFPEDTATPQQTDTPADTVIPEATDTPADTVIPEDTDTPTDTVKLEDTEPPVDTDTIVDSDTGSEPPADTEPPVDTGPIVDSETGSDLPDEMLKKCAKPSHTFSEMQEFQNRYWARDEVVAPLKEKLFEWIGADCFVPCAEDEECRTTANCTTEAGIQVVGTHSVSKSKERRCMFGTVMEERFDISFTNTRPETGWHQIDYVSMHADDSGCIETWADAEEVHIRWTGSPFSNHPADDEITFNRTLSGEHQFGDSSYELMTSTCKVSHSESWNQDAEGDFEEYLTTINENSWEQINQFDSGSWEYSTYLFQNGTCTAIQDSNEKWIPINPAECPEKP